MSSLKQCLLISFSMSLSEPPLPPADLLFMPICPGDEKTGLAGIVVLDVVVVVVAPDVVVVVVVAPEEVEVKPLDEEIVLAAADISSEART